jgi:hypothetical protein
MMTKSVSNQLPLATTSILGQAPRKNLRYVTPTEVFFEKLFGEKIALQV